MGQRLGRLQRVADRFGQGQGPLGFHQLANVYSRDELEDDVVQAAVLAHVVDPGDVVVIEPGRRLGLVLEAQQRIAVGRLVGGEDFQGHGPRQPGIEGAEDAAHPPAAHILHQVEVPQVVAGQDPPLEDAGGRIGHAVGDRLHRHRRPAGDDRHLVIGCGGAAGCCCPRPLGRAGRICPLRRAATVFGPLDSWRPCLKSIPLSHRAAAAEKRPKGREARTGVAAAANCL